MQLGFPTSWRARILLLAGAFSAGFWFWAAQSRLPDPVVEGRRMSEWAVTLLDHRTNFYRPYAYSRKHRLVFRKNRHSAIPHLIASVRYPTDVDRLRVRFSRKLPLRFSAWLNPEGRKPFARWLGLLALSDLARAEPDPRIPAFFLECMHNPHDSELRKIAAYESGPWLEPGHHATALTILRLALQDEAPPVRLDACRRIAESAGGSDPTFTSALQALVPLLASVAANDSFSDVSHWARAALRKLPEQAILPNTPLHR